MKFDRRHISSLYVHAARKAPVIFSAPPAAAPSAQAEIKTELPTVTVALEATEESE
jgi:hypothetical protein